MPTPPKPNPTRPAAPAARKTPGTAETPETSEQDPRPDEDFDEIDPAAQPEAEDGVSEDMGTLALHPGSFEVEGRPSGRLVESPLTVDLTPEQIEARRLAVARGDFSLLNDAEVMIELRNGNMAAFDVLLQKYRKPIVHFMFRMVHNQAVAEELAQEVFLRVYRSRETYRAEARFSTWLYRIATNLGVNHARDTRHERSASTVYLDETDAETGTTPDVADATPSAEANMLRRERMNAIRQHVMSLPERQQTAVLMHKYEGMDYKQIGEVLKLSESATKSLLFRAYQTLREKLKDFV
ncbi:RNA polymerase sigma factor [Granulicella paludicola]|jgi:RNA polymerase sigma-70 factor (ECF subfamily)|uniref:RNA polymerase sigma factor n=1 Tax=Granulicella paludicola TaxID=474951 RepID=UPI0021E0E461|nr:sigma-70 family RNA polymerase sigma factor [Granulicella paludicola]